MIRFALPLLALGMSACVHAQTPTPADTRDFREREPSEEIVYFVLPARFENGDPSNDTGDFTGGRLETGFDPTAKGFFHGGDLKGLTQRLDYLEKLGVTAIWFAPIFQNKPVQGRQATKAPAITDIGSPTLPGPTAISARARSSRPSSMQHMRAG